MAAAYVVPGLVVGSNQHKQLLGVPVEEAREI